MRLIGGRDHNPVHFQGQPSAEDKVGYRFPKVRALVPQSCPTLCDPTECSSPDSSVHGILQARILEWVTIPTIPFSRGSLPPRDWNWVFHIAGRFFIVWATREAPKFGHPVLHDAPRWKSSRIKYGKYCVDSGGTSGKEPACQCRRHRDAGPIPGSTRSPEKGNDYLCQYSCLEKPVDRGAWWAIDHRVTESRYNWSDLACTHACRFYPHLSHHIHKTQEYIKDSDESCSWKVCFCLAFPRFNWPRHLYSWSTL